jgi:hypothetical protein
MDGRQFSGHFTGRTLDPDASAADARPLKFSLFFRNTTLPYLFSKTAQ